ncbi:hypothetical protein ACFSO0_05280 [Brevibacillus sp. GCM10020057]|uniref:hypothetical protein n=1 Tax=Brevibacillus sp. GCM10020057 TaxID=3317327 RepID=UPI003629596C
MYQIEVYLTEIFHFFWQLLARCGHLILTGVKNGRETSKKLLRPACAQLHV